MTNTYGSLVSWKMPDGLSLVLGYGFEVRLASAHDYEVVPGEGDLAG